MRSAQACQEIPDLMSPVALQVHKPAPGGLSQDSSKRHPISAPDVFVGAVISVFSRGFELVEADEKTLTHMEENPELFPLADYGRVRQGGA